VAVGIEEVEEGQARELQRVTDELRLKSAELDAARKEIAALRQSMTALQAPDAS
jgi:polyhydroxyalkanoate synthesis regulator phasin